MHFFEMDVFEAGSGRLKSLTTGFIYVTIEKANCQVLELQIRDTDAAVGRHMRI